MTPDHLELLLIADVHYVNHADHECPIAARRSSWGLELVRRAIRRAKREGVVDAVVLMGDLVDNGDATGADRDLAELRDEVLELGVPIIAVPGNHDGRAERLAAIFDDAPGVHQVKGYQVITFADAYAPDDKATRSAQDLELCSRADPGSPIIALQHNPLHPPIESSYPYNLTNAADAMQAYEDANVVLSLSAHYHPGIDAETVNGVAYATCPALAETPFRVARLSVDGRDFTLRNEALAMVDPPAPLVDFHAHSQYAYCADDVTAEAVIEHAEAFGIATVHITEHAGQLYLTPEDYWGGVFRRDAGIIARERAAGRGRMDQFRAEMGPLRSDRVRLGLEVELDADRKLTLLDQDRDGWDVFVGAVHVILAGDVRTMPEAELLREFMRDTEGVVSAGVDVLAHPFRIFRRADRRVPTELYAPLAELLAEHGVAAEVNYHTNDPDAEFFRECVRRGAKISLGSDGHGLWEIGEFGFHLELLSDVVAPHELESILYYGR